MKIDDVAFVSLFIANKSQKASKWRSLDKLLEAWYKQLYPSDNFDLESKFTQSVISKMLELEKLILSKINYQTAFPGVYWIEARMRDVIGQFVEGNSSKTKDYDEKVSKALLVALSGPVLAAGGQLLLVHKIEAIVVGCFTLVSSNIRLTEQFMIAFNLSWRVVHDAANIAQTAIVLNGDKKHKDSNHREVAGLQGKIQFHWKQFSDFCGSIEIDAPLKLEPGAAEVVAGVNYQLIRRTSNRQYDGCFITLDSKTAKSIGMDEMYEMAVKSGASFTPIDDVNVEVLGSRKAIGTLAERLRRRR